jgi:hypothetical protein
VITITITSLPLSPACTATFNSGLHSAAQQERVFGRWQLQESGHRIAAFLHDALPRPAAGFACTNGTLTAPPFKRRVPLNVVSNRPQFSWRMLPTSGCSSPRAQLKSHEQHDATYLAGVCSFE